MLISAGDEDNVNDDDNDDNDDDVNDDDGDGDGDEGDNGDDGDILRRNRDATIFSSILLISKS